VSTPQRRKDAWVSDIAAQALGVEFHELPGLDHRTGLSATDRVMAVVEPFLAALASP
jgi:hypothetical protein